MGAAASKQSASILDGTADEFGDEPLLIARETGVPVYVAGQRYEAGLLAEAERSADSRFGLHLLDDGFQHRQLHRDVDILLLDRRDWQDGLLPAGNLREPLKAVRRAAVIAIPADEPELEAELRAWGWDGPVWRLHRNNGGSGRRWTCDCILRHCASGAVLCGTRSCGPSRCRQHCFPRPPPLHSAT